MTVVADRIYTGIRELAAISGPTVPRMGPAMADLARIPDAGLATAGGKFVWVGPRAKLRKEVRLRRGGARVDLHDVCVLPGFVDAHTHALFAGDRAREIEGKLAGRSYREIAAEGGGLFSTVRATRAASDAQLRRQTGVRLRRMRQAGTTSAEIKSGYALTVPGELRLLRLIPGLARSVGLRLVPTFLGAHAIPPEFDGRADAYVDQLIERALPVIARERLARFCDVFCEPGFFSVPQSARLLRAALGQGLGIKIHADEFVASGGARLAAELGARSAEHLLAAPAEDLERLAAAQVTGVLLPITPFASLSHLSSPGRALVDAGVPVALGTDLSPNSWVESMGLVLSHAVYGARLTPAEALVGATVNAAHASGIADVAGSIAAGRTADFLTFETTSLEEIPYRIGAVPAVVYRQGNIVFSR
ncbi:MAG: imidazolonepropionase [Thermoplasmata archaeon]|nr:imidazolonepropionase [Thermoplasmata archaeon]